MPVANSHTAAAERIRRFLECVQAQGPRRERMKREGCLALCTATTESAILGYFKLDR
jgi:hypothetical protein